MSINALSNTFHLLSFSDSVSGKVNSAVNGAGTFKQNTSFQDGVKTVSRNTSFADGSSTANTKTVTFGSGGNKNIDISHTLANGSVVSLQQSVTKNAGGTKSITGSLTLPNGSVDTVSGTKTIDGNGSTKDLVITNSADQTATLNTQSQLDGNTLTRTYTGTTFNGNSISGQSTRAYNNVNDIDGIAVVRRIDPVTV